MYCTSAKPARRTVRARHRARYRVLALGMLATLAVGTGGGPGRTGAGAGTGTVTAASVRTGTGPLPYRDPSLPVEKRVDDLMGRMSLDGKLGQMTQPERRYIAPSEITEYGIGSVLSSGGSAPSANTPENWADMYDGLQRAALDAPLRIPLMYGVDAVHGHNNVVGATIFPHNIGLGAARDPGLVREIGAATAEEMAATGVDWNFAPCVCVVRNDRWGRTYESFGEVPGLPSAMTTMIDGLQGEKLGAGPTSVLATAKHYLGDGGTQGGDDRGDSRAPEEWLREIHLPPFRAAVQRDVGSIMVSYSSWNGMKLHEHRYLITEVLKGELGFTGLVVSDYNGIDQIDGEPGFTRDEVAKAINAGIDMVMVPEEWRKFIDHLRAEVREGDVPMSRIDDANRRILTKKFQLGLFEDPMADRGRLESVGGAEHRALARRAVAKSQVLLKNSGDVLPLGSGADKIFVAGRSADDIGRQSGGWTITWQGEAGDITPGTSILEGIREVAGPSVRVDHGGDGRGIDDSYDAAIAVVGEEPYAEYHGDRTGHLGLDDADLRTIERLQAADVPVIVVLVSGRPLDVARRLPGWDALVASWLPGTEGAGVADVLFGDVAPTGRLPVTWMADSEQQPINRGDGKKSLFPFGYGLSY